MAAYPSRKSIHRILFCLGGFFFLLPLILGLATIGSRDAFGASIVIGLIMGPPGLMVVFMGLAARKLRLEIDEDAGLLRASLPRSASLWFPWQVRPAAVPLSDVTRVDVKWRSNPYMAGGVEGLYFIRTQRGDFHFNSKWFPAHEAIAARLAELAAVGTSEENLDLPPLAAEGGPPPKLAASEKAMRGCGYTLLVLSLFLMACALLLLVFGKPDERDPALKALFILSIGLPASRMLLRYRAAR